MKKHTALLGLALLLFTWSCQKESLTPTLETSDDSQFLKFETIEDLEAFEDMLDNPASAISRSTHWCGKQVHVEGGSKNALQDAIDEAGYYGLVVLEKGEHYVDGTILLDEPVYILGRKGAKIISDTKLIEEVGVVQPLFHIDDTKRVTIWGVEIEAKESGGGTGVLVENSTNSVIAKCTMNNFQVGIILEHGNNTKIWKNNVSTTPRALLGEITAAYGIVVINGDNAKIVKNKITNAIFGIWACDKNGFAKQNETYGNFIGLILCNVPTNSIPLQSGLTGSEVPGTNWSVRNNHSHDNFTTGYLVIDGANNNQLFDNQGGNNGTYDIELAGDSERFGFLTPRSFENTVNAGSFEDIIIKDCGDDNFVGGGVQIDINIDPCF